MVTRGPSGLFNDFYDYWAAAVMLNRGQNPYDIAALHTVQRAAGLQTETGTGYSYPVFFAHLLRPLALLSPTSAAIVFASISLVALMLAVALLLGSIPDRGWRVGLAGGALAGLFPPVIGSLYFGQANLLVLLSLALAYRELAPGLTIGLAAAVKLYPVSGFLAALCRRRWQQLGLGVVVVSLLNLLQLGVSGGGVSQASSFLGPDTYWSNESINGWLSRLAIASTWTRPPLPDLPVETVMIAVVILLTIGTVLILVRSPQEDWRGALALGVWLGVVAAPKNSLWNFTPLLLCVVFSWTHLRGRWPIFGFGAIGWLLIELQAQLDSARETVYQSSPGLAWLSSAGLYGGLMLGAVTAYLLLHQAPAGSSRVLPTVDQPAV